MSNSKMVSYTKISPNSNNPRNHKIDKITIHHMAGDFSLEAVGRGFADPKRQASANYGIDSSGRVALYVDEANRAWTSSNAENDHRAVTIEVANDGGAPDWHVSDKALEATIALCVDICKRNGIKALNFTGDKSGNLTMHKWFAATACPGPYLESKFPYIAAEVNKRLTAAAKPSTVYRVQVGAYKNKTNAEKQLAKVKAAGFDTYLVQVDGLYKIQVGAFGVKANAEAMQKKLKAAGFSAFLTTKGGAAVTTAAPAKKIEKGSVVTLKAGAKTYNGGALAPFVYQRKHTVSQINGDRAVITFAGVTVAAVRVSDLVLA